MTIDEAIKHCEEEAEKYMEYGIETECYQCGKEHEQLAEWLRELKELRNSVGAVKLAQMKEALNLISDLRQHLFSSEKDLSEAKRLLKLAVEDLEELHSEADCSCNCCKGEKAESCQFIKCWTWRYADEALNLIGEGGESNA